jgi:hypothetical protein
MFAQVCCPQRKTLLRVRSVITSALNSIVVLAAQTATGNSGHGTRHVQALVSIIDHALDYFPKTCSRSMLKLVLSRVFALYSIFPVLYEPTESIVFRSISLSSF